MQDCNDTPVPGKGPWASSKILFLLTRPFFWLVYAYISENHMALVVTFNLHANLSVVCVFRRCRNRAPNSILAVTGLEYSYAEGYSEEGREWERGEVGGGLKAFYGSDHRLVGHMYGGSRNQLISLV